MLATGTTMTAIVKSGTGPAATQLQQVPIPHATPGQGRIRVTATGICGTDLHLLYDEFPSTPPVVLGHEITGVVDEVGDDADSSWIGRRVALETYGFVCRRCPFCRSGRPNLCPKRRSLGSHLDGGFAQYVVAPVTNLHPVADHLPDEAGSLYEPLACVAHCLCDPATTSPGDLALVIGPGTIGLLAAQVLRAQGARVLLVGTERDHQRLAVAQQLGLTATDGYGQVPVGGVDMVAECSGSAACIASGLQHLRKGGRFVQIGLCGGPVPVEFDLFCLNELTLTTGFASTPQSWLRAERLVLDGSVQLTRLISQWLPVGQWNEAFNRTASGDGVKFLLDPQDAS